MTTTDTLINSEFQDGILTVTWKKSGIFKYRMVFDSWHTLEDVPVHFLTKSFLDSIFTKNHSK